VYRIFVGKLLRRLKRKWNDSIDVTIKEIGDEGGRYTA
jgi:hypothetical protein